MNNYAYCFNRPMDLVDLNELAPTADLYSNLETATDTEEPDQDVIHSLSDIYTYGKNANDLKSAGEIASQWKGQYDINKNLAETLADNPTTKLNAASEGVSAGRYRRVTRSKIKNGLNTMENIGDTAKSAGGFKVPYLDYAVDVGTGIYDNYQSGASAGEYVSDAAVDVAVTTGEVVATTAATTIASTALTSALAGSAAGSVVPGLGNVIGFAVGLAVGIGLAWAIDQKDWSGDGTSIRDNIKDFVFGFFDKGEDDEKE